MALRRTSQYAAIFLIALITSLIILHIVGGYREFHDEASGVGRIRPFIVPDIIQDAAVKINNDLARIKEEQQMLADVGGAPQSYAGDKTATGNKLVDKVAETAKVALDPAMTRLRDRMLARSRTLQHACRRLGMRKLNLDNKIDMHDVIDHRGNLDTLLWSNKKSFVTSVIHKSGSGNWKKFMMSLFERVKDDHNPKQSLASLTGNPDRLRYVLQHYLKIVTVRHPLIRFVSVYRDKFIEHTDKFRKDIPAKIARTSASGRATFAEFAKFMTRNQSPTGSGNSDPHWTPQYTRSRPCAHDYDIIVKLETSDEDLDFVFRLLGADNNFLPEYTDRHRVTNDKELLIKYYNQLSEDTFQRVCEFYGPDFDLFGYYRPESISDVKRIFDDFS